jgi:hypothetical protein
MSLFFQEQADGYRVVRLVNGREQMLARVFTRRAVFAGNYEHAELLKAHLEDIGVRQGVAAATEAALNAIKYAPTLYAPLPRAECQIHSAVGALTVADLEEILAQLPVGETVAVDCAGQASLVQP